MNKTLELMQALPKRDYFSSSECITRNMHRGVPRKEDYTETKTILSTLTDLGFCRDIVVEIGKKCYITYNLSEAGIERLAKEEK